jgi:pilus assembly protein Flp/PilA
VKAAPAALRHKARCEGGREAFRPATCGVVAAVGVSTGQEQQETHIIFEGRKESQMIQTLAARIQLAKMRAEDGQALVEYALIISLIAVVAIGMLTLTGNNINGILNSIANAL